MKFKLFFTTGLMVLSIQLVFSQSDFKPSLIVNKQYDTIYGEGNISKNQEYCLFKRFDSQEFTKYLPNEILAFRIISGKYYISRLVKEVNDTLKWYFLEYLVDGEIDLFTISQSGRFFIKKENADLLELNDHNKSIKTIDGKDYRVQDKKYLGYIRSYMSETPELFPKIDKMERLDQRDLVNLSVDYHHAICNEYECVNYTKNIPDITYKLELVSGVTYHNAYYASQIGLLVHIWRPLKNEKLYLKTGILYSDKPYWKKEHNIDKKDYNIKIPFSFQYVFGKGSFKPTIAIGFPTGIFIISSLQGGFICSMSKEFEISVSGSVDGLFALPFNVHKELYNNHFGHTINFGLIYLL